MSDYQNGQLNTMPSLQGLQEKQQQASYRADSGMGGLSSIDDAGLAGMAQQETVTSMLREVLMRLRRIEQKL